MASGFLLSPVMQDSKPKKLEVFLQFKKEFISLGYSCMDII
jgi:hypothetical protein